MKLIRLSTLVLSLMMVNLLLIPSGVLLAANDNAPSVSSVYLVDNVNTYKRLFNGSTIPTKDAKINLSMYNVDLSSVNNQTVTLYDNEGHPVDGITFPSTYGVSSLLTLPELIPGMTYSLRAGNLKFKEWGDYADSLYYYSSGSSV